jgi:hypothetical protein
MCLPACLIGEVMSNSDRKTSIGPIEWGWRTFWKKYFSFGRVSCQPEAADFNLAVTLVAPWEEYVLDLSPDFKLDVDKALDQVIPNTAALEEKIVDGWSASVQARVVGRVDGAGGEAAAAKQKAGTDAHQATKREAPQEAAEEEGPKRGKEKDGKQLHAKAGGAGADHAPSKRSGPGPATGKDPMLEYAAATALFQEVKLLNRYVADAALRRGYRAYVVRLQMSVVPFSRHLPFDVYSNISFFPTAEPRPEEKKEEARPEEKKTKAQPYKAEVIPLLVTDNLENTIKSRTVDTMRDLALTLSFLQPPGRGLGLFQGGMGLNRKREQFQRALGADLNSLLTVGRVTDNTLQVRLGAKRDVTSAVEYAMLPRTHNITVLLLVPAHFAENPDFVPRITAVSKTQLRDAETGTPLPQQSQDDRIGHVRRLCKCSVISSKVSEVAEELLEKVFENNVEEFEELLGKHKIPDGPAKRPGYARDLWCDIVETLGKSEFAAVRFELPPLACLPEDENVFAVDDGTHTTLRLQGGAGLNQNGVTATLFVRTNGVMLPIAPRSDPPGTEINIPAGGHGMTLKFPSLSAWNLEVGESANVRAGNPLSVGDGSPNLRGSGPPEGAVGSPPTQGGGKPSERVVDSPLWLHLSYAEGRKWSLVKTDDHQTHNEDCETEKKNDNRHKDYGVYYLKVKPTERVESTSARTATQTRQRTAAKGAARKRVRKRVRKRS